MCITSSIRLSRFLKSENSQKLKRTQRAYEFLRVPLLRTIGLALALLIGLLTAGCITSDSGSGNLEVRVTDHREAIDDFDELWLTISAVGIHPARQSRAEGWIEFEPSLQKLDLTRYVDGREAMIAQTRVETGPYNAVRLIVTQASGALQDGQPVEVKVSFETAALDFQVRGDRTTILELDLMVLDISDHPGQGYELHLREATVSRGE